jgi:hypothetical protein
MMRLNCSHDPPASATEGSPAVFEFSLSNPSAVDTIPLHSPMELLLEVLITTTSQTVTVPAGATTGTVLYQQLLILESMRPLLCLWNGFGYWNNQ